MHLIYSQVLNLQIMMLERGYQWTKTHGHFRVIQMGGNVAKGVLSPERFAKFLMAGR